MSIVKEERGLRAQFAYGMVDGLSLRCIGFFEGSELKKPCHYVSEIFWEFFFGMYIERLRLLCLTFECNTCIYFIIMVRTL